MSLLLGRRWWGFSAIALSIAVSVWWVSHERASSERRTIQRGFDLLRRGRPDLALRAVDPVLRAGSKSADALTVQGLALASLDRPEDAQQALKRSLGIRPDQPMALKVLAATYLNASDVDRGIVALREAARLDPADYRPWFALGDAYDKMGKPQEAASSYREALLRKPYDRDTRLRLVASLLAANKADEATPLLGRLRRDSPDDPNVVYLEAKHARLLGRLDDSARSIDRVLALDPNHRDALLLRSKLRLPAGQLGPALADAERAAALDGSDPEILNQLCLVESASGLKVRAASTAARRRRLLELRARMQELNDEVRARPDDPGPRWQLGRLAAESAAIPLAVRCYRAALHLDPQCQPALRGLAELGNYEQSLSPGKP